MLNNINNENIITISQMYEKMQPDKNLGVNFAKTLNYQGIHNNFCLDIPEIIEEEQRQQERRNDIAKFTKLAVSDIENTSHNDIVKELLRDDEFMTIYENEIFAELSTNEQLLSDIGLL